MEDMIKLAKEMAELAQKAQSQLKNMITPEMFEQMTPEQRAQIAEATAKIDIK